jgi:hypothetical protein
MATHHSIVKPRHRAASVSVNSAATVTPDGIAKSPTHPYIACKSRQKLRQSRMRAPHWCPFRFVYPPRKRCKKQKRKTMPRKPGLNSEFVMFDVVYEDGTLRSNRKVPRELTGGIEGDKPAHGFLIEQDRDIAEKSGRPLAKIKSITRSGSRKKERDYSERQFQ